MRKKRQKIIALIFLAFLLFGLANFVLGKEEAGEEPEERNLEIEYPEAGGVQPTTAATPLTDYIKYVFNFIVISAGIIGLAALILGGIRYLTSAGKAEKLNDARKQILAAFWGIIILLGAYIILTTVNPDLVLLEPEELPEIPPPTGEIPETPAYDFLSRPDPLERIKDLSKAIKNIPENIKKMANDLKSLTDKCDCQNTQSLCLCSGGSASSTCQPKGCYSGSVYNPCPENQKIENLQKTIADWRDVALYYENRVLAEKNDLETDIEKFLNNELAWYNEEIGAVRIILDQLPEGGEKDLKKRLIASLEEEKDWLEGEIEYKKNLIGELNKLAKAIAELKSPTTEIVRISSQCFSDVSKKCQANCKGKCHDYKSGCQPDKCTGGNPCPTDEIQNQVGIINPLPQKIVRICDEIISIIDGIEKTKIREAPF